MARATRNGFAGNVNLMNRAPPDYSYIDTPKRSRWDPKNWTRAMKLCMIVGGVALVIFIIVVAVVESRNNRYPAYARLSYKLQDTYEGSSFFDNFDYFTGYDPSSGFVQ